MFDQLTEDNFDARGESDIDEGEDARNLCNFRKKIEVLNKDLHGIVLNGEDGEDADDDVSQKIVIPNKAHKKAVKSGNA